VDVPIVLKSITIPLPKIDLAQDEFTAYVRVLGTIRARPRHDGLVDLEVNAQRGAGLLLPRTTPGAFGLSTHKVIAVRLGEIIAIEIPQPSSSMITTALRIGGKIAGPNSSIIRPGVGVEDQSNQPKMAIRDGNFVFNTSAFFRDHVTRLLIRVRPSAPGVEPASQPVASR